MMRTKVAYMLVALTAVAAANTLPKRYSTSVAALEDNATCEPLVLTDEPQCAVAIGGDSNNVEESSGLEKRAYIRNGLRQLNENLNKVKKGCTRFFLNVCSLNTPTRQPPVFPNQTTRVVGNQTFVLYDPTQPVPGTNITINESPPGFVISYKNDPGHWMKLRKELLWLTNQQAWRYAGYQLHQENKALKQIRAICTLKTSCLFHITAHILTGALDLSPELKDGHFWYFHVPAPKAPQNLKVDGAKQQARGVSRPGETRRQ